MKIFKTTIVTYIILSTCVILLEVIHYNFIRQNFDGFGPGLLAFALMIYVFPPVSVVIAAIVSREKPTIPTSDELSEPDERKED